MPQAGWRGREEIPVLPLPAEVTAEWECEHSPGTHFKPNAQKWVSLFPGMHVITNTHLIFLKNKIYSCGDLDPNSAKPPGSPVDPPELKWPDTFF